MQDGVSTLLSFNFSY